MEPPATRPDSRALSMTDTEKPLPETLVAPFRQTPQQREKSRLAPADLYSRASSIAANSAAMPGVVHSAQDESKVLLGCHFPRKRQRGKSS